LNGLAVAASGAAPVVAVSAAVFRCYPAVSRRCLFGKASKTFKDLAERRQRIGLHIGDPTRLFPMDGNDRLGDCTIAALAHAVTVFRALADREIRVMTKECVVKLYMKLTGGVDTGLNELDVMNYWRKHAVDADRIFGFAKIDPKNHAHVQQAIRLFGGVYLGFQCQKNCIEDFDAKKPWTPGPLTHDGHAVFAVGYDASLVTVLTWGNTQQGSWAWWDECVDEAYAILPPEAVKPDFAPGSISFSLRPT
jgi:hypothetical protein